MINHISDKTVLNNGVEMPWLGLGVWKAEDGSEVISSVKDAVAAGYRSIDTAAVYANESGVGQGIRECGVPREELFITTKLWNEKQGYESTLKAFDESMEKLGLDYLDLYLIHWPGKDKYKETWRAFTKLYEEGRVRAIGVSNFQIHHLEDLMADSSIVPAVNQVEYHPKLTQRPLIDFCKKHGIQVEAWSPLMQGKLLDHPELKELAAKHGKSVTQIILRWDLQNGVVTIPKSVKKHRIVENANIFDFSLAAEDMAVIDALNEDSRVGSDPDSVIF
ncbi:aldo/keto reductase [Paenibacillus eucommiae]|uniref:Diketogulonate reductase-like aldo/keto reductase n=1 Tax=Paenibacillus eucommiae TaxID=1355755 RepID=A0ABS4J826_9BACL|nr:aldo/keto reductase [Paenibacillus eucommiae]MBP1996008.1 diketogulonate reductase-like aldo/keto reductase [Paenibacillus eucommiae]